MKVLNRCCKFHLVKVVLSSSNGKEGLVICFYVESVNFSKREKKSIPRLYFPIFFFVTVTTLCYLIFVFDTSLFYFYYFLWLSFSYLWEPEIVSEHKMNYHDIIRESELELERIVEEKLNDLEFGITDEILEENAVW